MPIESWTSTKLDGDCQLFRGGQQVEPNFENLRRLLAERNLQKFAACSQVHGAEIGIIRDAAESELIFEGCDALITDQPGRALAIQTADCVPLFIWDRAERIVAAAHCGRRGIEQDLAGKLIRRIETEFGIQPSELHAKLGPSIRQASYEIGPDILANLPAEAADFLQPSSEPDRKLIDLQGWLISQLIRTGIQKENIEDSKIDTFLDSEKYWSYRRSTKTDEPFGCMISVITKK